MYAGLDVGDVEIIRNAGGRVTADVVRSLFVAQVRDVWAVRTSVIARRCCCCCCVAGACNNAVCTCATACVWLSYENRRTVLHWS